MEISKTSAAQARLYREVIPDLVYSTGPTSYDYHFRDRELFSRVIKASWDIPGTLFGHDAAHVAATDEDVLGCLISFPGIEFRERMAAMTQAWRMLLERGLVSRDEGRAVAERTERARWLNPEVRSGVYYIHAVAVDTAHRGKGLGVDFIEHAKALAKQCECDSIELDVLADNPAVSFYTSIGFEILCETRVPVATDFGVPPEYRMSLDLDREA